MRLFRVARPGSTAGHVARTAASIVVVWTFALVLLPAVAVAAERALGVDRIDVAGQVVVGGALVAAGSVGGLVSAWCMATRGEGTPLPIDAASQLVVAGPYRWVRNPMAVCGVVQEAGIAVAVGSPAVAALAVAGALLWQVVIRPPEEAFLSARFGAEYDRYRHEVPLWVPRRPRP
jgi:protein-S-isoprenylcysteine O-methyltransferase Ste14